MSNRRYAKLIAKLTTTDKVAEARYLASAETAIAKYNKYAI
jgi:hypothetical protein